MKCKNGFIMQHNDELDLDLPVFLKTREQDLIPPSTGSEILSNDNLFINPDFLINQGGETSFGVTGDIVDMWSLNIKNTTGTTVTPLEDGGINLTCTTPATANTSISYAIDAPLVNYMKGKTMTLWVDINSKLSTDLNVIVDIEGIQIVDNEVSKSFVLKPNANRLVMNFAVVGPIEGESAIINIVKLNASASQIGNVNIDIMKAKLEIGKTVTQFTYPDPALELLKVQRFHESPNPVLRVGDITQDPEEASAAMIPSAFVTNGLNNQITQINSNLVDMNDRYSNLANSNLLDNANFRINQSGVTEWLTYDDRHLMDRWYLNKGKVYAINSSDYSSIRMIPDDTSNYGDIMQLFDMYNFEFGVYYSASAMINGIVYSGSEILTKKESGHTVFVIINDICIIQYNHTFNAFELVVYDESIIRWTKFEKSSAPTPYVSKSAATDLLVCQRYYEYMTASCIPTTRRVSNGDYVMTGIRYTTSKRMWDVTINTIAIEQVGAKYNNPATGFATERVTANEVIFILDNDIYTDIDTFGLFIIAFIADARLNP